MVYPLRGGIMSGDYISQITDAEHSAAKTIRLAEEQAQKLVETAREEGESALFHTLASEKKKKDEEESLLRAEEQYSGEKARSVALSRAAAIRAKAESRFPAFAEYVVNTILEK
jgi:vacuolar-type H+-ATPase subunit H